MCLAVSRPILIIVMGRLPWLRCTHHTLARLMPSGAVHPNITTAVVRLDPSGWRDCARNRSFQPARGGPDVSLSGIDVKVGTSAKRITRRRFRLRDRSEWAEPGQ